MVEIWGILPAMPSKFETGSIQGRGGEGRKLGYFPVFYRSDCCLKTCRIGTYPRLHILDTVIITVH